MLHFKALRSRHWAWALYLAIVGIWWPIFIITTPPEFLAESVDLGVLTLCMIVAMVGSVAKISGYLASQMPGKAGVIGVSVELAGLILATIGPGSYVVVSLVAAANPSPNYETTFPNSALILAIAILAVYLYRAIIIVPRFLFEAHDSAKDDS